MNRKWFESVLFLKSDGRCTGKFHSGNIAMEASFLNRVIGWEAHLAGAELEADTRDVAMVLRDLGLEKATPVVILVAKRPESFELLLLESANPLNAEDTTLYRSVTIRVIYFTCLWTVQTFHSLYDIWHEG